MRLFLTTKQEQALREGIYNEALAEYRAVQPRPETAPGTQPRTEVTAAMLDLQRFIVNLRARYLEVPSGEIRQALATAQQELRMFMLNDAYGRSTYGTPE